MRWEKCDDAENKRLQKFFVEHPTLGGYMSNFRTFEADPEGNYWALYWPPERITSEEYSFRQKIKLMIAAGIVEDTPKLQALISSPPRPPVPWAK